MAHTYTLPAVTTTLQPLREAYWYNTSTTPYWNRMWYYTMPNAYLDYSITLLVTYTQTTANSKKIGILKNI